MKAQILPKNIYKFHHFFVVLQSNSQIKKVETKDEKGISFTLYFFFRNIRT